jgi:hypothetical protein
MLQQRRHWFQAHYATQHILDCGRDHSDIHELAADSIRGEACLLAAAHKLLRRRADVVGPAAEGRIERRVQSCRVRRVKFEAVLQRVRRAIRKHSVAIVQESRSVPPEA